MRSFTGRPCKFIVGGDEKGRKEDFFPVEWILTLAAGGEEEFCWNDVKLHKHRLLDSFGPPHVSLLSSTTPAGGKTI